VGRVLEAPPRPQNNFTPGRGGLEDWPTLRKVHNCPRRFAGPPTVVMKAPGGQQKNRSSTPPVGVRRKPSQGSGGQPGGTGSGVGRSATDARQRFHRPGAVQPAQSKITSGCTRGMKRPSRPRVFQGAAGTSYQPGGHQRFAPETARHSRRLRVVFASRTQILGLVVDRFTGR